MQNSSPVMTIADVLGYQNVDDDREVDWTIRPKRFIGSLEDLVTRGYSNAPMTIAAKEDTNYGYCTPQMDRYVMANHYFIGDFTIYLNFYGALAPYFLNFWKTAIEAYPDRTFIAPAHTGMIYNLDGGAPIQSHFDSCVIASCPAGHDFSNDANKAAAIHALVSSCPSGRVDLGRTFTHNFYVPASNHANLRMYQLDGWIVERRAT